LRLSTSLRRDILETTVGGVLNRFKIRGRRDTLFFEEIPAYYIRECEKAGYVKEMRDIGQKWGFLIIDQLVPSAMKRLSAKILLNTIMKKVWVNLGLMNDLHVDVKNDIVILNTKNESITRFIGENEFAVGLYMGILNALCRSEMGYVNASQSENSCRYVFEIGNEPFYIEGKKKSTYNQLNSLPKSNKFALKDALRFGIFQLKSDNRIYFRNRLVVPIENTIFHLVSDRAILLDRIPPISYDFFKDIIKKDATNEERLNLLKTLLQVMGWGTVKIVIKSESEIVVEIENPPYGLQLEKDSLFSFTKVILGYLWLLNDEFKIKNFDESSKHLRVLFSS